METILKNKIRVGNFTSSEIVALTKKGKEKDSFGVPALTYIEECNWERRLGRSIDSESNARPLTWGQLGEKRVFELLPLEYQLVSDESIQHPEIDCWSGSPDANKFDEGRTVVEIKCPITLKSFCQLVDPLYNKDFKAEDGNFLINQIRENHKDGEKYYWQTISNSILTNSQFAELIIYCPYESELEAIREMANHFDGPEQHRYKWIAFADNEELPYLPDFGYYKNINIIRFEVPQEDKNFLKQRVLKAKEKLNGWGMKESIKKIVENDHIPLSFKN